MSIKVFMPGFDDKRPVFPGKFLSLGQLLNLEAMRFAEFDDRFDSEDGFARSVSHMDMGWPVLVALEEKPVAIFLEDFGHDTRVVP